MSATEHSTTRGDGPRRWSLAWWIDLALALLAAALLGLVLSILIEWAGIYFDWWTPPDSAHSAGLLEAELDRLGETFTATVFAAAPVELARSSGGWVYRYSGLEALVAWASTPTHPGDWISVAELRALLRAGSEYLIAAANMAQVFGARLAVVLLSLPVYALFALIGMVDGLVQRDLRRFGGGIESGFFYHHLKLVFQPLVWLPVLVYLASPVSLHPTLVFVPPAIAFGWITAKTAARFKKYL